MISGAFIIPTVCSLQFAAVNRDNMKEVFSVHTVVWTVNDVELYRGLTVINFIIFPRFRLLIYLALQSLDRQKSQTLSLQIYRMYYRKIEKMKSLKLNCIMN